MSDGRLRVPVVRLGEIAKIVSGGTPSRANPAFWGGDIPWVKTANIRNGRIGRADIDERITEAGLKGSSARVVPAGTILMAMYGQGGTRGRVSILDMDAAISQNCAAVVLNEDVDAEFVFQVLRYHYAWLRSMSNAGSLDFLSNETLLTLRVPLPPVAKQRRVAHILATWDSAVEKTQRLVLAKRGMLVGLVQSTARQADDRCRRSFHLGEICAISKGSGLSKGAVSPEGKRPCILYGELYTSYDEVVTKVRSRTNLLTSTESRSGDVLIPASTTTNAADLANATAVMQDHVLLGGDINILRGREGDAYDPEYLAYYLTHVRSREISRLAQGSTIVHLYGRDLARVEVALPDAAAQRQAAVALRAGKREIEVLGSLSVAYGRQKRAWMSAMFSADGNGS